tara:strand:+ start:1042 stop:1458 length:417 start_codon:yes stop_codon:yes gene_type:complete
LWQDGQSIEAAVLGMVGVVTTIGVVEALEDEVDSRFCLQLLAEQQRRDVTKELTHSDVVPPFYCSVTGMCLLYAMHQNDELIWSPLLHFEGICWETLTLLLRRSDLECCFEAVHFSLNRYVFDSHVDGRQKGQRNEFC